MLDEDARVAHRRLSSHSKRKVYEPFLVLRIEFYVLIWFKRAFKYREFV